MRGRMAAGAAVLGLAYDNYHGAVLPRTARVMVGAAMTFVDYKYLMDDTTVEGADHTHKKVAERWHAIVCANEGLYVKLGQQVTTMGHILPPVYMRIFSKLQDNAPQISREDVDSVFMRDFGARPVDVYESFDYTPVASASIAQVHKARLHDGTKVAVKVQKPLIEKQVAADLWAYRMVVWGLELAFDLPMFWTTHDVCDAITQELDFRCEMRNAQMAKRAFQDTRALDDVYIPDVYEDMTTSHVMTMEWVDGVKVTDRATIEGSWGLSCARAVNTMVEAFSEQIFLHGHVHGDPHPGNVFVRPHPTAPHKHQLIILDHGMYVPFSEKFRREYCKLWKAMVLIDMETLEDVCASWGIQDATFFASSQMFKPYSKDMLSATQKPSRDEILEMRTKAKERVRLLLHDTNRIPRELIILGRNLNIVRAVNKDMGSPVNRAKVLASYASLGLQPSFTRSGGGVHMHEDVMARAGGLLVCLHPAQLATHLKNIMFWVRMVALDMVYRSAQVYRYFNIKVLGRQHKGFEQVLDQQMQQNFQKLGLELNIEDGLG